MRGSSSSSVVLWLVVLAAPVALGFETLLRWAFFPAEFDEVRAILEPLLTPLAWIVCALSVMASAIGVWLQRRMNAKRVAALPDDASAEQRKSVVMGVFLLTSSVPQIPTIAGTFMYMFGSSLWPVLVAILLCTIGVAAQAWVVRSA